MHLVKFEPRITSHAEDRFVEIKAQFRTGFGSELSSAIQVYLYSDLKM